MKPLRLKYKDNNVISNHCIKAQMDLRKPDDW